ncbi:MAG: Lrp/AsnC ligand binding domain-containing protein [Crocinitomicaceae bacterium]|nr:Lrp/AsnC ligand binding domain-containing protein [Crocinitomicaceae bacterium]
MSLQIDSTDRKILKYLTRDARVKVTDIASYVGMTSAAIHQRLAKIKKAGYIKGYTVQLDEKKLGYHTCAFVGIFMDRNSHYTDIVEKLNRIDEVVEAHYTTGVYGLFVKLYARDNDHLMQILNTKVQEIKGITRTETFISLEEPINRPIPV